MASQPIPELQGLSISERHSTPSAADSTPSTSTTQASVPLPNEPAGDDEINPWASKTATPIHRLQTPDPSTLEAEDKVGVLGPVGEEAQEAQPDKRRDILDDLGKANVGENVWQDSGRGEPPPPSTSAMTIESNVPAASPSDPHVSTIPASSSEGASTIPSFPSLAALARSFSIKKRPMSVDMAASVPSPDTLSAFATQQQQQQQPPQRDASNIRDDVPQQSPDRALQAQEQDTSRGSDADPPFDFQKFLDQMKTRPAEPVSKYLKSFLTNFAKRTFTVSDQIKIINDFLVFIAKQMRETDIWANATQAEFDNAMEGMEKLVMNQLYQFTFTPAVAQTSRRAQITADDLERDRVLEQRIRLLQWLEPKHLDIPVNEQAGEGFLAFAQQEMLKINSYKAPRDKLICILNCCKVIFGYLRHLQKGSEGGADDFVPILIYTVIKANPHHLLSNVEFISRFRSEKRMGGEPGYYLSSLMGAVSFIETMDHTALSNIAREEFEWNVEQAIQSLPPDTPPLTMLGPPASGPSTPSRSSTPNPSSISRPFTPDAISLPAVERLLQKTGSTIGRLWNEALDGVENVAVRPRGDSNTSNTPRPESWHAGEYQTPAPIPVPVPNAPYQTPYKPRVRRVSPSPSFMDDTPSRPGVADQMYQAQFAHGRQSSYSSPSPSSSPGPGGGRSYPQPNFAAYPGQVGTPTRPPHRSHSLSQDITNPAVLPTTDPAALDTLTQIFPGMDKEIVEMVLDASGGDVGKSIEGLLEMSAGA